MDNGIGINRINEEHNDEMNNLNGNNEVESKVDTEIVEIERVWTCNILSCLRWIIHSLVFVIWSISLIMMISYYLQGFYDDWIDWIYAWRDDWTQRLIYYILSFDVWRF